MQVAAPSRSIHATGGMAASASDVPAGLAPWSDDDQALLDILLLCEPLPDSPSPSDVKMADVFDSPGPQDDEEPQQVQQAQQSAVQPASPVRTPTTASPEEEQEQAADSPSQGKLTTTERRARHREVVKRAYHRNKAALKGLRDTVKTLETQLEKLSLSQKQQKAAAPAAPGVDDVQRRYTLLTTQQEHLGQEAARLRLMLSYRQQFAVSMVSLAQRAASLSGSDGSENSDDSDSDATASTSSPFLSSPVSSSCSSSTVHTASNSRKRLQDEWTDDSPSNPSQKKSKGAFYNEPRPTYVGPAVADKAPLAMAMRKQLGYKPLTFGASKALVNETYRAILSFSLSGKALSTGANIMGWEDKRLLDGTSLKFSLRKRFPGQNALQLMTSTWQCFSDPVCTEAKFRGLMTLRILQRVNDDTIVAMRESLSEDGAKVYRCVYLLFRVRTRKGFLICVQSIAPERIVDLAQSSITREGKAVQWVDLSGWFVFEPTTAEEDGDVLFQADGAQVEYGGCMDNGDHESVATLAMNTLSIVFKWENMMVGPLFMLPSSA
ncbi:hypothetical protein BBJ28_00012591 [Nothophytophthora sp. Chile5]|nr:hypothetical protein BBJ28_00012591 [Nothophytophthora sp. Chile5]